MFVECLIQVDEGRHGIFCHLNTYLRNKSRKPECVLSLNMGWRILVNFIPRPWLGIKFTNICQPMLKLKTYSGFHDLFRF
jgi:hypothetical protein